MECAMFQPASTGFDQDLMKQVEMYFIPFQSRSKVSLFTIIFYLIYFITSMLLVYFYIAWYAIYWTAQSTLRFTPNYSGSDVLYSLELFQVFEGEAQLEAHFRNPTWT